MLGLTFVYEYGALVGHTRNEANLEALLIDGQRQVRLPARPTEVVLAGQGADIVRRVEAVHACATVHWERRQLVVHWQL